VARLFILLALSEAEGRAQPEGGRFPALGGCPPEADVPRAHASGAELPASDLKSGALRRFIRSASGAPGEIRTPVQRTIPTQSRSFLGS